jgi:DNA (cytosine-5)-methyltransferase 1
MTAYYNENDKQTCAWLRELIKQNLIAPGDVDERDIRDVKADELIRYAQIHFFAGIGVWSYALRNAGWPDDRPVLTGSCPCQPFSSAGKKDGTKDKRHLWPEMFRLIAGLPKSKRPPTIFGEQVAQKAGQAWFDAVQADLARENYAAGLVVFPACSVGAPHLRQRLYWFADNVDDSNSTGRFGPDGRRILGRGETAEGTRQTESAVSGVTDGLANVQCKRNLREIGDSRKTETETQERRQKRRADETWHNSPTDGVADHAGIGCEGVSQSGATQDARVTKLCKNDGAGPTNGFWQYADWLWCRDEKWRPVEPGLEPLVDRSAARVVRLRGYGNAIVAPQAQAFIESYLETE